MTVIIPEDYHAKEALEKRRIFCITQDDALKQDIRALRIGILNIMPRAESYEYSLLFPLSRTLIQIEPIWIRLKNHQYRSSNQNHLDHLYISFEEAVKDKHLDGLILTGAPVEEIEFEEVTYWNEINEIVKYARENIASTLGICWGGLALAKIMGINKTLYKDKLFGVFETENINKEHKITGEIDDVFWCPQSRFSGISKELLELESKKGNVNLLAYSKRAGYVIFESSDQKLLMHLGHPEYDSKRLPEEYYRDLKKGRTDVNIPENVDLENPINRWRSHCLEFFSQWIKYVYETTPF